MKNKEVHPFRLPVEWPNLFLLDLKDNGAEVTSHDIQAVKNAVQYDIARKLEFSEQ